MQHDDPQRAAAAERKRRRRDDHLAWKAITFAARPPPPFVHVEEDEEDADAADMKALSAPSAALVALIRRQPFGTSQQDPSPAAATRVPCEPPAAEGSGTVHLAGSACDDCKGARRHDTSLSPLERRLKLELDGRQPLLDPKRTPNPQCTMGVFALPLDATDDDLRRFGERFGRVATTRLVRNATTGASRRYGFVQFAYARELEKAVRECNDPLLPKPRIRGKLVVVEAERARIDGTHVPARLVRVRDKVRQDEGGASTKGADATEAAPKLQTAESILDNIDDYLLSL